MDISYYYCYIIVHRYSHSLPSYSHFKTDIFLTAGEIIEVRDIDMWDPEFNVKDHFDLNFLKYLKRFYDANTDDKNKGLLSFSSFVQWADVKNMLA